MRDPMSSKGLAHTAAAGAFAVALGFSTAPAAQAPPSDLTRLAPVSKAYAPPRTPWGDPDFRGKWPLENINVAHIPFQRAREFGDRVWVTDQEFAKRLAAAKASDAAFSPDLQSRGTQGLARWMESEPFARRTSMLVAPADGQLPAISARAEALRKAGRSSWVPGQSYDWIGDFDSWDRCISRGFPASMLPFRYNNGIRVFQSPGYVVIALEMLGTRIIPLDRSPHPPKPVETWMGDSRGHWEGNTLVIETTNIKSGDNATSRLADRAASPLNMATQGVPLYNSIPTSRQARAVERLTMTGPRTITYELTYSDPAVFARPWTARLDWTRDDNYQSFEYACHEGNYELLHGHIIASRAQHAQEAAKKAAGAGGG